MGWRHGLNSIPEKTVKQLNSNSQLDRELNCVDGEELSTGQSSVSGKDSYRKLNGVAAGDRDWDSGNRYFSLDTQLFTDFIPASLWFISKLQKWTVHLAHRYRSGIFPVHLQSSISCSFVSYRLCCNLSSHSYVALMNGQSFGGTLGDEKKKPLKVKLEVDKITMSDCEEEE